MATILGSQLIKSIELATLTASTIIANGNITVTGTVDGRDISADGTKLDTIETGATADQTKADIDALGIDAATLDSIDSLGFARLGTVTHADNYLYTYRTSVNSALYVRQGSTGPIASFFTNAAAGSTSGTNQVDITNTGGITTTGDVTVGGNLTVSGTSTTINSTTVDVQDKNITIGNVTTPTDITADGGGLTLKGTTDKTITWTSAKGSWDSNQPISVTTASAIITIEDTSLIDSFASFGLNAGNLNIFAPNLGGAGNIVLKGYGNTNLAGDLQVYKNNTLNTVYHSGNLSKAVIDALAVDAGTLDGLDSTQFVRSDVNDTISGDLNFTSTNSNLPSHFYHNLFGGTNVYAHSFPSGYVHSTGATRFTWRTSDGVSSFKAMEFTGQGILTVPTAIFENGTSLVSKYLGISAKAADSDLLDGNDSLFYLNASNINAGTIADAYLPATISSDITGNAATATLADNVSATLNDVFTGTYNLLWDASGVTYQSTLFQVRGSDDTLLAPNFAGSGAGLTNLNASNINAGTIADAYLPATISSDITGNAATATNATNATNAANAALLDNLDSTQFLRSDVDDSATGNITFNGTTRTRYPYVNPNGEPSNNLGDPTITEMALFQEQFNNKLEFYDRTKFTFEYTTDGTNWIPIVIADADLGKFIGGDATSPITITNSWLKYRITILNNGYTYLNALYMYWSGQGNSTLVHVWKQNIDDTWVQHTNSTKTISSWPGHMYLPFTSIPWNVNGTQGTHYKSVRIEFTPTWSHATNPIALYKMQIWGGYPAGKRTVYSTDYNRNVTFPANLNATNMSAGTITATTGFSGNLTGIASQVTVSDHTTNNTNYPVVWHNNSNTLYDSVSKFTFNPSTGNLTATSFQGNGSLLTSIDAATLDGIDSTGFALVGHNHTGVYEPVFSKNTGFNKNFGTTAGTVSEGDHTHSALLGNNIGTLDITTDPAYFYYDRYSNGTTNQPPAINNANGVITLVTHTDTNYAHQLAFQDANGAIYTRRKVAGVWQSWGKIWNEFNDGVGSGLNADLLDGLDSTAFEPADATILKSAAIGVTVQGYNINTVIDAAYVHTDNNFTTLLKTNYDTAYTHSQSAHAPSNADNTAANETSHADVLVDGDFITAGIMKTNGAGIYSILTDNSANWNTAFSWGDHSTQGYLTAESQTAADISVSTTNFTTNLSALDNTVQKALDTLDDLIAGGTADADIARFNANQSSNDGIVTLPKTIHTGQAITIPTDRQAVISGLTVENGASVTIEGTGEIFIPNGGAGLTLPVMTTDSIKTSTTQKTITTDNLIKQVGGEIQDIDGVALYADRGFKNLLLNPYFDVDQRDRTTYTAVLGDYGVDRWSHSGNSNVLVVSKNKLTDNRQSSYHGFFNNSGAAQSLSFMQIIESSEYLNGETVTFSVNIDGEENVTWLQTNIDYTLSIVKVLKTASPINTSTVTVVASQAFTNKNSTNRSSITATLPTDNDYWYGVMITANNVPIDTYFLMYKTQFEIGSYPTEYEQRPYGLELQMCQRYYQTYGLNAIGGLAVKYAGAGGGRFNTGIAFPVKMRVTPTATVTGTTTYENASGLEILTYVEGSTTRVTVTATGSYRAYNSTITYDAEL